MLSENHKLATPILGWLLLLASICGVGPAAWSQEGAATLRGVLASGQAALAAGEYAGAYAAFERIESEFGREPEVKEPNFQSTVIPVHAYAALLAGERARAISLFETFLERFPDDTSRLSFVLFNLARAQADSEDFGAAIETYRRFVAMDPNRAEAALATLEAARLMFLEGQTEEALTALDLLYERQPDGVLRTRARLLALQEALKAGMVERARVYMLETDWAVTQMPELAVLAFAAMDMGRQLLETGAYADAIRCFRLVPPYRRLVVAQRERLTETRQRFEQRRGSIGLYQGGQFWTQFYTGLIARIEGQLRGLEAAEDYTSGLFLSLGQAYLLDERPREAWLIFERLARDPQLSLEQQSEAHYRWILAAMQVGVWEDAFEIAKGFERRFPDSPLVPDSYYLLATAYQEAGAYRDAVDVLTAFLENHGNHPLGPRVRFLRGFNYNLLNQPALARADFDVFIRDFPQHSLWLDARYWRVMSFFGERDYDRTLAGLNEMSADVKGHRLEPEIAYRQASTLYAMRDYEDALLKIRSFLAAYPHDSRVAEARVLLGDIQMGRGDLNEARAVFAAVDPAAGHLFTYAVFQVGKILRAVAGATEDEETEHRERLWNQHIQHFTNYLEREDIGERARTSDALYWIGWTHLQKNEDAMARAVFEAALEDYGDAIEATEVALIVEALGRIEGAALGTGRAGRDAALTAWIENQRADALERDRLTYYARLNFYLDDLVPADADPATRSRLIFDTVERVPLDRLDPEGLGRLAAALSQSYPNVALAYLEALEDQHPENAHRVYAYYARARLDMQAGNFNRARDALARFRIEAPMHRLSIEAALLYAETLTRTGDFETAQTVLEELLRLRQARGRPHARALLALSKNAEASGELKRAVPYAQRVYTVYRAYPELAAAAYQLNATQFEALGDLQAAIKTLEEMLADERIKQMPEAAAARKELERLQALTLPASIEGDPSDAT